MQRAIAVLIFVCAISRAVVAADLDLEKQLGSWYKDQILSLRHPFMSQHQVYGPDGEPANPASEDPWTLYGRIRLERIVAHGNELQMNGSRVLCEFTKNGLKLIRNKEKVTITVRLNQPLASDDEAVAVLGRVFALTPEEIVLSAPDYWREYLRKDMLGGPDPEKSIRTVDRPKDQSASDAGVAGDGKEGNAKAGIFHLGEKNVTAPKPQYTPEPAFTEAARKERYQGVVGMSVIIDPEGRVRKPRIVHALGLGLDEAAIATVSTWRFAPGRLNDQPVSVAVYIEVDFHWY